MMIYLFYFTTFLLIITKLPDLHSTLIRMKGMGYERNPMARFFMKKIGNKKGLYFLTLVYVIFVLLIAYLSWIDNGFFCKLQFIVFGLIVSVFNLGVAHHNYTGKNNFLTKILEKTLGGFYR